VPDEETQQLVMESIKRMYSAAARHPKFEELASTFGPFQSEKVHSDHLNKIIQLAEETGYFNDENDPMPEALKATADAWEQVKREDRAKAIHNVAPGPGESKDLEEDDPHVNMHKELSHAIDSLQQEHDVRQMKKIANTRSTNIAKQPDRAAPTPLRHSHRPESGGHRSPSHGGHLHIPPAVHKHAPSTTNATADDHEVVSLDELGDSVSNRVDAPKKEGNPFGGKPSEQSQHQSRHSHHQMSHKGGKMSKAHREMLGWGHRWHWHVPHRWHWHVPHRWHVHIPHFHIPPPSRWGQAIKDGFNWVKKQVVNAAKLAVQVAKSVAKAAVAVAKTVIKKVYAFAKTLAIKALKLLCKGMSFGLDKAIAKGIKAVGEIGAHCVMAVGKLVSMAVSALKDLFAFRHLRYEGSMAQIVRGNWGTTELGLLIASDNHEFKLRCDLSQGVKCIEEGTKMVWGVIKKAALKKFKALRL